MPVFFETGVPQAWAWTLLAPWIQSCPEENPKVGWSNFPALTIENEPRLQFNDSQAAVSTNRTALTQPSQRIDFTWEDPGKKVGPDNAYVTTKNGDKVSAFTFSVGSFECIVLQSRIFFFTGQVCSLRQPA